jgi:hypothetical protein
MDLMYHTNPTEKEKTKKMVIRGLSSTVPIALIKEELALIQVEFTEVRQLLHRPDLSDETPSRRTMPLFVVTVPLKTTGTQLHTITSMLRYQISVEKYRGSSGHRQCFNCQQFGHSLVFCHLYATCFRCAGPHLSSECLKPRSQQAKCVNCKRAHTTTSRSCPAYKYAADNSANARRRPRNGNPSTTNGQAQAFRFQTPWNRSSPANPNTAHRQSRQNNSSRPTDQPRLPSNPVTTEVSFAKATAPPGRRADTQGPTPSQRTIVLLDSLRAATT